jgi:hypothetical protein
MDLQYQSPRKIAEAVARQGNPMRPRLGPEGSLRVTREAAGGYRSPTTMGSRRTFSGKRVRVRDTSAAHRLTTRGRYVQAKYGE